MKRLIGLSTGYFNRTGWPQDKWIEGVANVQRDAIEVNLRKTERLIALPQKSVELIRTFAYRSIHGPSDIRYPSTEAEDVVPQLLQFAQQMNTHVIVFHPDRVDDFKWMKTQFGSLLAYENMDWRKSFGRTLEDMQIVFQKAPDARWVFDVNHIYTWDNTMKAAHQLYAAFKDRLAHYHLSGFGGTSHQCLAQTHEDLIFSGIKDEKPIIIESVPVEGWVEPNLEYAYIINHLPKTTITAA